MSVPRLVRKKRQPHKDTAPPVSDSESDEEPTYQLRTDFTVIPEAEQRLGERNMDHGDVVLQHESDESDSNEDLVILEDPTGPDPAEHPIVPGDVLEPDIPVGPDEDPSESEDLDEPDEDQIDPGPGELEHDEPQGDVQPVVPNRRVDVRPVVQLEHHSGRDNPLFH